MSTSVIYFQRGCSHVGLQLIGFKLLDVTLPSDLMTCSQGTLDMGCSTTLSPARSLPCVQVYGGGWSLTVGWVEPHCRVHMVSSIRHPKPVCDPAISHEVVVYS